MPATIRQDPNTNWGNDHLQFARLLTEAMAVGAIQATDDLCESMDLSKDQVQDILDRAARTWTSSRNTVAGPRNRQNMQVNPRHT